jgi:beta-mannosidase
MRMTGTSEANGVALLDRWQFKDFAPGEGLAAGAQNGAAAGWIDIPAPGDIYTALIDAKRLAHPFEGRHEADAGWVRDREWWWQTTFIAPPPDRGEQVRLVFEGLDTFATIYLDGEMLGKTSNMFRTYTFDISEALKRDGLHRIAICFATTAESTAGQNFPAWGAFADRISSSRRNLMRKAQFGWGWDWGPDLPTVGIWQPVRLERRKNSSIASVNFTTLSISEAHADARVSIDIDRAPGSGSLRADISLLDPDGRAVLTKSVSITDRTDADLEIPAPRLWWTAEMGTPSLYTLQIRLYDGDVLVEDKSRRVGIRTLVLDTSPDPDEPGTSFFRFVLNGVPIFAKGACWIPASSFVADIGTDRYRDLMRAAVDANMNMIRIWGGGIYEPDAFYDICDELGLLVWQDFMFACAPYPEDDPVFVENVRREIEDQVRRLRGHACIALWCGNNENQAMHWFNGLLSGEDKLLPGALYYDTLIPGILAQLDPQTAYWPGSPEGGPSPNSMRAGDVHNWTVWHGIPLVADKNPLSGYDRSPEGVAYTRYAEDNARFVSEFGIQAAPAMATLKRWMASEDLELGTPGFLGRVKDVPEKANAMMRTVTGIPANLEEYVDFTMWTQAEGMKFGIEHYRRRKPHCSGALIWQFNDCWPCVSWSLVDYDGEKKASYHAVKRAFAPVLASFKALGGDRFELWITNDTLTQVTGNADIALATAGGETRWRERIAFDVAANGSVCVWQGEAKSEPELLLVVRSPDGAFLTNRHLMAPISRIPLLPGAAPAADIASAGPGELRVDLAASTLLLFVHLTSERPGLSFSDNYFDMEAGEKRTITVRGPDLNPRDISIRCWNNKRAGR